METQQAILPLSVPLFFNANTTSSRIQPHPSLMASLGCSLVSLYQQAMHRGTHDAHFPIFRLRGNREIACWWQAPNPLSDRTINCAAARPAGASGSTTSYLLVVLTF